MNEDRLLEREITSIYEETAPSREPEGLLDDVLLTTSRTRQRPSWLALIKEPSMRISSSLAVGSPTTRVAAILVATLLISLMVAGAGVAGSRLLAADDAIVVDQSGNGTVTTITEAVAMAEAGDTVLVRPGTYDESIAVTKDITIRGDGDRDAIIVELSTEMAPGVEGAAYSGGLSLPAAFTFEDSEAALENLTVRGESSRIVIRGGAPALQGLRIDGIGRLCCGAESSTPTGLTIMDGSTATIKDNLITSIDIDVILGASPSLSDNEVIGGGGIWMQGDGVDPVIAGNSFDGSAGLSIWGGARPTVEANTFVGMTDGITVQDGGWRISDTGTDPVIRGNTISGATAAGISVDREASALIEDNELTDNATGIEVRGSDAALSDNVIREGRTGVNLAGSASPVLEGNTIESYEFGLMIGSDTTPLLTDNIICGNGTNLLLAGSAEMPDTAGNEICADAPEADE